MRPRRCGTPLDDVGNVVADDQLPVHKRTKAIIVVQADSELTRQQLRRQVDAPTNGERRVTASHELENGTVIVVSVTETRRTALPAAVVEGLAIPGIRGLGERTSPFAVQPLLTTVDQGLD